MEDRLEAEINDGRTTARRCIHKHADGGFTGSPRYRSIV